jgi:hypothetical protein
MSADDRQIPRLRTRRVARVAPTTPRQSAVYVRESASSMSLAMRDAQICDRVDARAGLRGATDAVSGRNLLPIELGLFKPLRTNVAVFRRRRINANRSAAMGAIHIQHSHSAFTFSIHIQHSHSALHHSSFVIRHSASFSIQHSSFAFSIRHSSFVIRH